MFKSALLGAALAVMLISVTPLPAQAATGSDACTANELLQRMSKGEAACASARPRKRCGRLKIGKTFVRTYRVVVVRGSSTCRSARMMLKYAMDVEEGRNPFIEEICDVDTSDCYIEYKDGWVCRSLGTNPDYVMSCSSGRKLVALF